MKGATVMMAGRWAIAGASGGVAGVLAMESARIGLRKIFGLPETSSMIELLGTLQDKAGVGLSTLGRRNLARMLTVSLGATYGAGYGLLAGRRRLRPGPASGLLFGSALYLADTSVPGLLGAGIAVWQEPAGTTARRLALHALYGLVLGLTSQVVAHDTLTITIPRSS